ncbi:MAG TPA: hypothetical protein VJ738_05370 [Steroidobacteraceae bacterium]|nr:hypothetical protein [Steroidobacteraceae bacterium]
MSLFPLSHPHPLSHPLPRLKNHVLCASSIGFCRLSAQSRALAFGNEFRPRRTVWPDDADIIIASTTGPGLRALMHSHAGASLGSKNSALGAQRRVEARIGQLLGETDIGQRHDLEPSLTSEGSIKRMDRNRFRLLARGRSNCSTKCYRASNPERMQA